MSPLVTIHETQLGHLQLPSLIATPVNSTDDVPSSYALTPLALTSPFSPILRSLRQSGQYHFVVRAGMSKSSTHSRWNHSCLQFCRQTRPVSVTSTKDEAAERLTSLSH